MQIIFLQIGKTSKSYIEEGINEFSKRIKNYTRFESKVISILKNKNKADSTQLKKKEAKLILAHIEASDFVVLLDEKGKAFRSIQFADWIQGHLNTSTRRIFFVVGGAFGFDQCIYQRANMILSLSAMTFSHQLIRLIFLEQLYRAFTIIRNEKYHNE